MKKHKYFSVIILVITAIFAFIPVSKTVLKILYPLRYEDYIQEYSSKYNLDEYLIMALIKTESNYIYDAHSGIARGLMQITDDTAVWIAEKMGMEFYPDDIENPEININMGCYYLRYLLDYYDWDIQYALAAYNAGMGNVNKWLENSSTEYSNDFISSIPFSETQNYLKKINHAQKVYEKLYRKV